MRNKLQTRRLPKYFTATAIVFFLILGGSGIGSASAKTSVSGGSLVKGSSPTIYFVTMDGKRLSFPNSATYFSWYKDFSTVKTITNSELKELPLAGSVTIRPGMSVVKFGTKKDIYAVAHGGILRKIKTPQLAAMIFGNNWAAKTVTLPSTAFSTYKSGAIITAAGQYWWKKEQDSSPNILNDKNIFIIPDILTVPDGKSPKTQTTGAFAITVSLDKFNLQDGTNGEDARSFTIQTNKAIKSGTLTITEKNTQTVFYTEKLMDSQSGPLSMVSIPDDWGVRLKPKTAYSWKVAAIAGVAAGDESAATSGDFTTADFVPSSAAVAVPKPDYVAANIDPDGFNVLSVNVFKKDGAEDTRAFTVNCSVPPDVVTLTIWEKNSKKQLFDLASNNDGTFSASVYLSPADWPVKLAPKTAYKWQISAWNEAVQADAFKRTGKMVNFISGADGEFTTTDFTPSKS